MCMRVFVSIVFLVLFLPFFFSPGSFVCVILFQFAAAAVIHMPVCILVTESKDSV